MMFLLQIGQLGRSLGSALRAYFDPANKDASFTLSNANATAVKSGSGAWKSVRGLTSRNAGKWYAEINLDTTDTSGYSIFGVANASAPTSNYCGSDVNGWSLRFTGTTPCTFNNGTAGADLGTGISQNQRAMLAYDADTGKIWFGMNGTWVSGGDPGAGTGAQFTITASTTLYLMLSSFSGLTYTLRNNSGENAHAIPSGFSMWA